MPSVVKSFHLSRQKKYRKRLAKAVRQAGWFRKNQYGHFDKALEFSEAKALVENLEAVANHKFLPFIRSTSSMRKLNRAKAHKGRKKRPIAYASHQDAAIFAYYNFLLGKHYEAYISSLGMGDAIIAYRAIEDKECNIHFAKRAIDEIRRQQTCVAVACDLQDFFETLGHAELLEHWKRVLRTDRLPPDHFSVFRAVTTYRIVEFEVVVKVLGSYPTKTRWWDSMENLRRKVLQTQAKLAKRPPWETLKEGQLRDFGIPQGSPISGLLANLVMLTFDKEMVEWAKAHGGKYWRYSDDILWVGPVGTEKLFLNKVNDLIGSAGERLALNKAKTEITTFEIQHDGYQRAVLSKGERVYPDGWLQYLGFVYDGKVVRIRHSSLAKFMRRMKGGASAAIARTLSNPQKNRENKVFERGLWSAYAYNSLSKRMTFPKYVHKCAHIFGGEDAMAMKRQIRRSSSILKRTLSPAKRNSLKIRRRWKYERGMKMQVEKQ